MISRVERWGAGLAIRIPRQVVNELRLTAGTCVELRRARFRSSEGGKPVCELVIRFGSQQKPHRLTLGALIAGYRPEHRQCEWNLGKRLGKEVW